MYPGMIEAYSHLGLVEISSTRSTIDMAETGSLNPNVSAHISVNPDSELIPVTRANGVLIAVSVPTGVKVILMGGHDAEMCVNCCVATTCLSSLTPSTKYRDERMKNMILLTLCQNACVGRIFDSASPVPGVPNHGILATCRIMPQLPWPMVCPMMKR